MSKNLIILLIATAVACFAFGYLAKTLNTDKTTRSSAQEKTKEQELHRAKDPLKGSTAQNHEKEINYSKVLKGKYILTGAEYAGFNFMNGNMATWTNELFPNDPDSLRINWINNNTFVATFVTDPSEDCPPNVWIKQVASLNGKKLKLIEINTSWVDSKNDVLTFVKER